MPLVPRAACFLVVIRSQSLGSIIKSGKYHRISEIAVENSMLVANVRNRRTGAFDLPKEKTQEDSVMCLLTVGRDISQGTLSESLCSRRFLSNNSSPSVFTLLIKFQWSEYIFA